VYVTLSYPACTAYAPYHIAICGLSGSNRIFPHHLIKARFSKKITEHTMCVLIFATTFVWNVSRSKKNSARYYHQCWRFACKIPVILVRC